MRYDSFSLHARDDCQLQGHRWLPKGEPEALLQITHGMAEHAGRYAYLAESLCRAGYGVFALDLRGHGRSAGAGLPGHFAERDGWGKLLDDQLALNHLIRRHYPLAPIILLGHSIGCHIVLAYLLRYSCSVSAAILSGASYQPRWRYRMVWLIAQLECWRQGPQGRSALLDWLSFGRFNQSFRPARTAFDWLSRDPAAVDAYIADPYCGFRCTNQLWLDLLAGLQETVPPRVLARIDAELPLLLLGGTRDPVSPGQRQHVLCRILREAGLNRVELKLYPEARHELFNESNRDEVIGDLLDWLARLPARPLYCPL